MGLVAGFSCLSSGCLWCFRFCGWSEMLFGFCVSAGFVGFAFPLAWSNRFGFAVGCLGLVGGVVCFPGVWCGFWWLSLWVA